MIGCYILSIRDQNSITPNLVWLKVKKELFILNKKKKKGLLSVSVWVSRRVIPQNLRFDGAHLPQVDKRKDKVGPYQSGSNNRDIGGCNNRNTNRTVIHVRRYDYFSLTNALHTSLLLLFSQSSFSIVFLLLPSFTCNKLKKIIKCTLIKFLYLSFA